MKKLLLLLLILSSFGCNVFSQGYAERSLIDSLNDELAKPDLNDTTRIKLLSEIGQFTPIFRVSYWDTIANITEKALTKTKNAAEIHSLQKSLAGIFNNIGVISNTQGQIKKALEYFHKALRMKEEIGDKNGIASSLNNIGVVYQQQGQTKKTLEYFHKSLKITEEIGDKPGMAYCLNNIGVIYKNQGQLDKALEYYQRSLKIREEIEDKNGIANSLNNIGVVYKIQGQLNKALEYYQRSLKIQEEIGDKIGLANSLNNIGVVYLEQNKLQLATEYLNQSLELAQELGSPELIGDASNQLSTIAQKQGDYKTAFEMYQLHITMRDSINNKENYKASVQQRAKYEYEKQKAIDDKEHEKKLAIEKAEKEKHKLEVEHQQQQKYFLYGGLVLALLFGGFIFNRFRVTSKQKSIIEDQKAIVDDAYDELEEKNHEILDSINYAKRIQTAILPPPKLVKEYLPSSFILYKPKDIVAGDFYWMEHKDGKVLFAAADCTGHGVPGAMVSVVCNNGLNRSVREHGLTDPGLILDKTREIVIQEFEKSEEEVKDGMDIALCSLQGNQLNYAGGHNPLWIIRNGAEEIEEIKADKQPIGKFGAEKPFTNHSLELQKGDSVYIFSDGFADQFGGEKGKKFKSKNFKKLLLSVQQETMERQREIIDVAFEEWKGDLEQLDDVCVIGVRVLALSEAEG